MVVHSILICSAVSKKILFSKLFTSHDTSEENMIFEQRLLLHTEPYWHSAVADGSVRSLTMGDICVVFQSFGSLLLLISGVDDIDELILADIIACLQKTMSATLGACRQESSILETENYAKLTVLIDEIVSQGIIESLDPEIVVMQSKLRN